MHKLWRRISLIFQNAVLYILAFTFIVYVFSLLQSRIEFIIISVAGLLYVNISLHRLVLEDQIITSMFLHLGSAGKLRVILKAWTQEEFSEMDKDLAERLTDRLIVRKLDKLYLGLVEVFCVYQLLKHINETFSAFVDPLIPHALKPYF